MSNERFFDLHESIASKQKLLSKLFELASVDPSAYTLFNSKTITGGLNFKKVAHREELRLGACDPVAVQNRLAIAKDAVGTDPGSYEVHSLLDEAAAILKDVKTEQAYASWVTTGGQRNSIVPAAIGRTTISSEPEPDEEEFVPDPNFRPRTTRMFGWQVSVELRTCIGTAIGCATPTKIAEQMREVLNTLHYYMVGGPQAVIRDNLNQGLSQGQSYGNGYTTGKSWGSSWTAGVPNASKLYEIYTVAKAFEREWKGAVAIRRAEMMKTLREQMQSESDLRIASWLDDNSPVLQFLQKPEWAKTSSEGEKRFMMLCWFLGLLLSASLGFDIGAMSKPRYVDGVLFHLCVGALFFLYPIMLIKMFCDTDSRLKECSEHVIGLLMFLFISLPAWLGVVSFGGSVLSLFFIIGLPINKIWWGYRFERRLILISNIHKEGY